MIQIRRPGPSDWEVVRDVRLRALVDSPDSFGATLARDRALPETVWRDRLAGPNPTFLAIHESRAVAMGGGFATPDDPRTAMVWGMWTDPGFRGQGLGRRILDAVLTWSSDAGRTPYLHVTEGNDGARALYVSCGFEPTGVWELLREGSPLRVEELVLSRG